MNEVVERLKNYLNGYKSQYDYLDDNGLEHCLDDDIKQLLEIIKKLQQENQELKKIQCTFLGTGCQGKMKALKNQQKEFINYLEKEIVDSKAGSGQQYYAKNHLKIYKEIIGGDNK